jgi:DNA-directed RNA polymerase specialized sigma24 family protein
MAAASPWKCCNLQPELTAGLGMPGLSPPGIPRRNNGMCMKAHNHKQSKSTLFNTNPHEGKSHDHDLEAVAEELVELARARLPDHVMKGALIGCEDDIRQEAVLLALKWYIRQKVGETAHERTCWNAAKAICAALRYCKLNAIKRHEKEQQARRLFGAIHSQSMDHGSTSGEWSPAEIRELVEQSIQQALKDGLITHLNASIAIQIYVDGVTVKDLAHYLSRTTGAIHQHLTRVRQAIPEIIHSIRESA